MLTQLTIQNFAIVDSLDLDLKQGMTVITGETGAGKSIMLDALSLTLGDRADKEVIRTNAERADISALFSITDNAQAQAWLKDHDLDADDECLLRRVITAEGRSRAYINGQQTTLNELKELGELLIDIHSQHEHQSLLRPGTHQRLLDEFCQAQELAGQVADLSRQWRDLHGKLEAFKSSSEENNAKLELLSYQVKELDDLALENNELQALEAEHQKLSHAGESLELSSQLEALCTGGEDFNILQGINQALSLIEKIPYKGKHLEEAGKLLESAQIQMEEAGSEISHSLDQFDLDPERLQQVDERLSLIHQLARKHRVAPSELYDLHQELNTELQNMSHADSAIEGMEEELNTLLNNYQKQGTKLSKLRQKGSKELEKNINTQLALLGMSGSSFKLQFSPHSKDTPNSNGLEKSEFLISTNVGQTPKALNKIASGGELSRISLAIQVVTAQTSSIPTLVFDEVDVGIGGGVALTVGELLRTLGDKGQVICVTHQPQVASQSNHHLYVSKKSDSSSTSTQLKLLDKTERIEEIARMLGGDKLTDQSIAHAKEMIA